ncbi:MAG TPA: radical SAM protein [Tepidisphaeraceae bacterium]|jgi:aminodeoxyfutalosine synthase|nr:radical SAM protein [Tepidisphaeraceae bacterium]
MPHDLRIRDPALHPIAEKIQSQEPLSQQDGELLYASPDIHSIGRLANLVRTRLHGQKTYFNRNRHINYTNVCALSCKFCSFYRKRGEEGAYEMPLDQVIETAIKAQNAGATEVHIVGGLHPWLKFDYYLDMLRGIRSATPSLHIKAFTAIEIIHFTRIARLSIKEVLQSLREAGLGSLPGGGAEIFDDRVHDQVFKGKVRANKWFEVHQTAHELGIPSNATMLYGHVETPSERITHLIKLRNLQAESLKRMGLKIDQPPSGTSSLDVARSTLDVGRFPSSLNPEPRTLNPPHSCFNCMIPLSFIPENSELGHLPGPTGLTDLKTLAISRLMLNNISHIKAFWIMQGIGLSQIALSYGCDDLDGTVVWYDITKRAGQGTHQELHISDIHRLIREAGFTPTERDTLYHPLVRDEEFSTLGT